MSIKVEPSKLIRRFASNARIKRLFRQKGVTLNRTALAFIDDIPFIDKKAVTTTALNVMRDYKKRLADDKISEKDLKRDPKLLISRVQNTVMTEIAESIKVRYAGERYRWLPSDAETPDPEHQLNYGQIFVVGEGEMPGDRPGCQCGMEILTDDEKLDL